MAAIFVSFFMLTVCRVLWKWFYYVWQWSTYLWCCRKWYKYVFSIFFPCEVEVSRLSLSAATKPPKKVWICLHWQTQGVYRSRSKIGLFLNSQHLFEKIFSHITDEYQYKYGTSSWGINGCTHSHQQPHTHKGAKWEMTHTRSPAGVVLDCP